MHRLLENHLATGNLKERQKKFCLVFNGTSLMTQCCRDTGCGSGQEEQGNLPSVYVCVLCMHDE